MNTAAMSPTSLKSFSTVRKLGAGIMAAFILSACSEQAAESPAAESVAVMVTPSASEVTTMMLSAMGGEQQLAAVQNMVLRGNGTRAHLGQIPATGAQDPAGALNDLVETIDFVNGRAAFDNEVQIGAGFTQHRTEAYTLYNGERIGWGTTEGRPDIATSVNGLFSWATHNTPVKLLSRNPITAALAASSVSGTATVAEHTVDGETYWQMDATLNNVNEGYSETIGLLIDQEDSLLAGFTALDTETMWGDQNYTYLYSDYRPVEGLMLPYALTVINEATGEQYASLQYDSITLNDNAALAIFDVPAEITDQADQVVATDGAWVPLEWSPVAENVTHIVAFSHHSMVVEFPSFVVVIEGAYTEGQSLTLARMIEENIGKPIRYVVPTHPHYDHTGGIRGLASLGANVLVASGHEDELRMIVESPHTNPPDALAANIAAGAEVGQVEVYEGSIEITEGDQTLILSETFGIPHVEPKVLPYVPNVGVVFQSDLFFGAPGPDATALFRAIQNNGWTVQQIVGGHGGVLPFSALAAAFGESGQ